MSSWREKEWRIARKGEVVRDIEGNLGIVTGSLGTLTKRTLCVSNINGTEMYTNEDSEFFVVVDIAEAKKFHIKRLALKGLSEGVLCMFNDNEYIPLEIVYIEWSGLRDIPLFWLKDLREYEDNIFKTDNEQDLKVFDLNLPPIEQIYSCDVSGLKYRLDIKLIEVDNPGWAGSGSPWEFMTKDDALHEVEAWKCRLKIRRLSSVINAGWNLEFPAWSIDINPLNFEQFKIVKVDSLKGYPGYFKTASHAAACIKMIGTPDWYTALNASIDPLY